jgi:hypothetical protein
MNEVPLYRLYMLRAMYALIAFAMGSQVWRDILLNAASWQREEGVMRCMLGALSLLCLLGLRYPLQMLPLLLWEAAWKTIWLAFVPLPQWWAHGQVDAAISSTVFDCSFVVLVYIALPWGYVVRHYVRRQGDRWGAPASGAVVR